MIISFITPLRRLFVVTTLTSSQQQQPPLFSWFFDGLYEIGQAAVPINMIILGINISTSFFDTKKKYISSSFFYPPTKESPSSSSSSSSSSSKQQEEENKNEGQEEQKKFVINQNHQHHPKKEEECILLFTPQHYMFESKTPTPLSSTAITLAVLGKMLCMPMVGILSTYFFHTLFGSFIPSEMSPSIYLVMMMVFITPTANNVMVMVELSQGDDLLGIKEILSKLIGWQYLFSPLFLSFHVALLVKLVHGWQ